jgi:hypothetical protein
VPVGKIRRTGRNAQGVKVVTPDGGTVVRAIAKVVKSAQEGPDDVPPADGEASGEEPVDEGEKAAEAEKPKKARGATKAKTPQSKPKPKPGKPAPKRQGKPRKKGE